MSEATNMGRIGSTDPEDSVIRELHTDLARLRYTVDQWNPHHPQQALRLRGFGIVVDTYTASLEAAAVLREQGIGLHDNHLPQLRERLNLSLQVAGVRPDIDVSPVLTTASSPSSGSEAEPTLEI